MRAPVRRGRILEPPPERGCVRRTSRRACGCQSRRIIPNRVASPCRCGWCSAHSRGPFPRAFGGGRWPVRRHHQTIVLTTASALRHRRERP